MFAKRFTRHDDLLKENEDLKSQLPEKESITRLPRETVKLKHISPLVLPPKDIGVRLSPDYGKATITSFMIPEKVKKLEFFDVSASISGTTTHGFLDLVLVSPNGLHIWCPDTVSWSSINDNGVLILIDGTYTGNIKCVIPDQFPSGVYRAVMGLYENDFKNRQLVHHKEKELIVE